MQDPPKCTAEQYSQCDTAAECELKIGPGCTCYVSSTIFPFDASSSDASCTGKECDGHVAECSAGGDGEGNTCMIKFDLVAPPPPPTPAESSTVATVTGATTLPSTGGGDSGGVTTTATTAATVPATGGGDVIIKDGETNSTTNSTGTDDKVVETKAPNSGNVARVSISLLVASAAVFGYIS